MYFGGIILAKNKKKKSGVGSIYVFALTWIVMAFILPLYEIWGIAVAAAVSSLLAFLTGKYKKKKQIFQNLFLF